MVFEVRRDDLHQSRFADSEPVELEDGQALLRVDRFGLTSNNITYAVLGDAMNYWDFFPAESGWGRMPVWGFADVATSRHNAVEEGARLYGYLPPGTELVVTPEAAGERAFVDASPHRAELPAVYNRYLRVDGNPAYTEHEPAQMLLRPLFLTSFLLDEFLADQDFFGARTVIVSSASSKTALAAAFLLAEREELGLIGLTSPGKVDFTEGAGVYDRVVTYDAVAELPMEPSVYVDISGDAEVRAAVHGRFGDELAHSAAVGMTHWQRMAGGQDLPGPEPTFFFAADRVRARMSDRGPDRLPRRSGEAWGRFAPWSEAWLEVVEGRGPEAVERVYREVLDGDIEPATGHVLSLPD